MILISYYDNDEDITELIKLVKLYKFKLITHKNKYQPLLDISIKFNVIYILDNLKDLESKFYIINLCIEEFIKSKYDLLFFYTIGSEYKNHVNKYINVENHMLSKIHIDIEFNNELVFVNKLVNFNNVGLILINGKLNNYFEYIIKDIPNKELTKYCKKILTNIHTNDFSIENINTLLKAKYVKTIDDIYKYKEIVKNFINVIFDIYKHNIEYIKDIKPLSNLHLHRLDLLYTFYYTDLYKSLTNITIYSFNEILDIIKLYDSSNCMELYEKEEYLNSINSFYNYSKEYINNSLKYNICRDELKVKLLDNKIITKIINIAHRVMDLLDEYNIEYWLDGGTLLGTLQNNKFIPWDDDVDLGITLDNLYKFAKIIKHNEKYILKKYNLKLVVSTKDIPTIINKHSILILAYDKDDSQKYIDIIPFTEINNKFHLLSIKYKNIFYNKEELFPLRTALFENRICNIPNNPYPFINIGYPFWRHIYTVSHSHVKELDDRDKTKFYLFKSPYILNI